MYNMKPIVVQFPLRGEWLSPNTPGKRVPSHGTDQLGMRYAYDFLQVDWTRWGKPCYRDHWLHYLLFGVPLHRYYSWGQDIYAPCDGVITKARDGYRERSIVRLFTSLRFAITYAFTFDSIKDDIQTIAGNYVIMKCDEGVYAAFVHLQTESIKVFENQRIKKG